MMEDFLARFTLETLESATIMVITGILVVFLGMLVLVFCIWLLGKIFTSLTGGKKTKEAAQETLPAFNVSPAISVVSDESDDEELIAVITAAINASLDDDSISYRVTRVRRRDTGENPWGNAGILENTRPF